MEKLYNNTTDFEDGAFNRMPWVILITAGASTA